MMDQHLVLIFVHVPKAAGGTLYSIITRQYPLTSVFQIDGRFNRESIQRFKHLLPAERGKFKVVAGHMPFGLHAYIPGASTYITLLRNPVKRIISHYYYVRRCPEHYLHDEVVRRKMSLLDYVTSGLSPELENGQVRLLCGNDAVESGHEPATNEMLEISKRNIQERFIAVGLTEKFDETIMLLKRLLGWKQVYYSRRNVTSERSMQDRIMQESVKEIEARNQLDIQLYSFAVQRFEQQTRELGPEYAQEVAAFAHMNATLGPIYSVIEWPRLKLGSMLSKR